MNGTVFYKMSGSGNDFVFVDGRSSPVATWTPEAIQAVCRRRVGVGADGLSVLEPGSGPGAARLHYFNSDGGRATLCGNSALCATRLAAWLGLAPAEGMTLETDAGTHQARCLSGPGELAEVSLGVASPVSAPKIDLARGERVVRLATVGVPHLVLFVEDLKAVDVASRGRALRSHPALGPAGANVNFLAKGPAGWAMRTYERGVEAETLACGTGAAASAAVVSETGEAPLPWRVRTASGAELGVRKATNGSGGASGALWLSGEGRMVYRGVLGL